MVTEENMPAFARTRSGRNAGQFGLQRRMAGVPGTRLCGLCVTTTDPAVSVMRRFVPSGTEASVSVAKSQSSAAAMHSASARRRVRCQKARVWCCPAMRAAYDAGPCVV